MGRARFSLALGPAGGSLEYELEEALADVSRLRDQQRQARDQAWQWEQAWQRAETERLRLERELAAIRGSGEAAPERRREIA
jgi:uncharacterized protein (DUF3084 family)